MKLKKIKPRCKSGWPHYISADGIWYPCCYVSTIHKYWKNDWFNLNRSSFDTNIYSLEKIITSPLLKKLESLWEDDNGVNAPYWCKKMCGRNGNKSINVIESKIDET